jgi:hypothetical protein
MSDLGRIACRTRHYLFSPAELGSSKGICAKIETRRQIARDTQKGTLRKSQRERGFVSFVSAIAATSDRRVAYGERNDGWPQISPISQFIPHLF